jgi:hypothetical protein
VLSGEREPVFTYLPEEVQRNMQRRDSESALLWAAFYPFAHSGILFRDWSAIRPLWGSPIPSESDDRLIPYFWGLRVDATPLEGMAEAAHAIAGREDRLEVDLYLKGERVLVAIDAKTDADPAGCGRYEAGRCPNHGGEAPCRYWEGGATFYQSLVRGPRDERRKISMRATLSVGAQTPGRRAPWPASGLEPHLCLLILPTVAGTGGGRIAERVRRRPMEAPAVVAWEDLQSLGRRDP